MVQVPVLFSMVTMALLTPLIIVRGPSRQTPVLPASTDNVTVSPELEPAATGKVLPLLALDGAGVENVIV